jgi:hypothetical protein
MPYISRNKRLRGPRLLRSIVAYYQAQRRCVRYMMNSGKISSTYFSRARAFRKYGPTVTGNDTSRARSQRDASPPGVTGLRGRAAVLMAGVVHGPLWRRPTAETRDERATAPAAPSEPAASYLPAAVAPVPLVEVLMSVAASPEVAPPRPPSPRPFVPRFPKLPPAPSETRSVRVRLA